MKVFLALILHRKLHRKYVIIMYSCSSTHRHHQWSWSNFLILSSQSLWPGECPPNKNQWMTPGRDLSPSWFSGNRLRLSQLWETSSHVVPKNCRSSIMRLKVTSILYRTDMDWNWSSIFCIYSGVLFVGQPTPVFVDQFTELQIK